MAEFERRVTQAHRAGSVTELRELLGDLPGARVRFESIVKKTPEQRYQFLVERQFSFFDQFLQAESENRPFLKKKELRSLFISPVSI